MKAADLRDRLGILTGGVTIRTKILGIVLCLVLLLGLCLTLVVRVYLARTLEDQLEKRGVSLARDVAARSTDLLLTNNTFALFELLRDTVENNEDVRYAFVLDQWGDVVVSTFGASFPRELIGANAVTPDERFRLEVLDTEEGLIRDVAVPIFEHGTGVARVGMSERGLRKAVEAMTEQLFLVIGLVVLAGILAAVLLTIVLTRPILDLVEVAGSIGAGHLDRKARVWARDEIGRLSAAFNAMTERLDQSQRQIAESNRSLTERNRELSALNAVAEAVSRSTDLQHVLSAGLTAVLETMSLRAGWVFLREKENGDLTLAFQEGLSEEFAQAESVRDLSACVCATVAATGQLVTGQNILRDCARLSLDVRTRENLVVHASIPLTSKTKVLGVLNVAGDTARAFTEEEIGTLSAIGHQIGMAIENSLLWEELRRKEEMRAQLLVKVIAAQEEERKRIARELHDETSQALTSLMVGLKALAEHAESPQVVERTDQLRGVASHALKSVHSLAVELRPSVLDDLGLVPALERYTRDYARRHDLAVDFQATGLNGVRLPYEMETTLYRVVQEALTNAAKHARASDISVLLERRGATIVAIVEDDGCGFAVDEVLGSGLKEHKLGLFGMQERAALVNGQITIESRPGSGTTVFVEIPVGQEGVT